MSDSQGDRRGQLLAGSITATALSLIALALRFWSRATSKKVSFWWDDWLALASAPFVIASCALGGWWVSLGLGLHVEQAQAHGNIHQWRLVLFIESLVYNTGLSLVKLSVVLFYFRIFRDIQLYRYALWIASFLVVAWCIGINLMAIFYCIPVQAYWELTPGHCIPSGRGFLGTTISNVLLDAVILLLPLPMLWKLHLDMKRKIAIGAIFVCGYCVIVVSIVRIVSIISLGKGEDEDFPWRFFRAQLMVSIEVPIALFGCCLPAIFQLAVRLHRKGLSETIRSTKSIRKPIVEDGPIGQTPNDRDHKHFIRLKTRGEDDDSTKV